MQLLHGERRNTYGQRRGGAHTAGMVNTLRRLILTGIPAAATCATLADAAESAPGATAAGDASDTPLADGFIQFADASEKFRALFRFERDLQDQGTALSTYQFLVFAVLQGQRPRPMVRFEGMEYSYFRRVGAQSWRIHAHNLSYPRDVATGRFVEAVKNPFTDELVPVKPMRLLDDPGVLQSPKGYLQLNETKVNWHDSHFVARIEGDLIKAEHIRPAPEVWPTMFIESSVSSISKREFEDPRITSLMYQTSGFYIFPFPAWVRMGDKVGHMLGAWNGRKIRDPRGLPREFLARARAEDVAMLEPRWGEFENPVADVVRSAY